MINFLANKNAGGRCICFCNTIAGNYYLPASQYAQMVIDMFVGQNGESIGYHRLTRIQAIRKVMDNRIHDDVERTHPDGYNIMNESTAVLSCAFVTAPNGEPTSNFAVLVFLVGIITKPPEMDTDDATTAGFCA